MTAAGRYKGEDGGLYGGGQNAPPKAHAQAAAEQLARIVPLDARGRPAPDGKVVLMSIGMSNTTQEFSEFKRLADADPARRPEVVIVDAAQGGQAALEWDEQAAPAVAARVWEQAERRLQAAGVTPAQVQAVWIKQALKGPARYGEFPAHARAQQKHTIGILHAAARRLPNLRVAYLSSRIYGGYGPGALNPEPYAYEGAFAVRWIIQDQIREAVAGATPGQPAGPDLGALRGPSNSDAPDAPGGPSRRAGIVAGATPGQPAGPVLNWDPARGPVQSPIVLWGPYLWADGVNPRKADGLLYKRSDLAGDGTHPSPSGRRKVADQLLTFFKTDPLARPWFAKAAPAPASQPPGQSE